MVSLAAPKAIEFVYPRPDATTLALLAQRSRAVRCDRSPRIACTHAYWHLGFKGASPLSCAREGLVAALEGALARLPEAYSFIVFDAFRTRETQFALYDYIHAQQKRARPELSDDELHALTREFVAHPEKSRFRVTPHNSGGAVDLSLARDGVPLSMGTEFDEVSPRSATAWFEGDFAPDSGLSPEAWAELRHNRRLLFNVMCEAGFVNYHAEWWHYDLGDAIWAEKHGLEPVYAAMEEEVKLLSGP